MKDHELVPRFRTEFLPMLLSFALAAACIAGLLALLARPAPVESIPAVFTPRPKVLDEPYQRPMVAPAAATR